MGKPVKITGAPQSGRVPRTDYIEYVFAFLGSVIFVVI